MVNLMIHHPLLQSLEVLPPVEIRIDQIFRAVRRTAGDNIEERQGMGIDAERLGECEHGGRGHCQRLSQLADAADASSRQHDHERIDRQDVPQADVDVGSHR